MAYAFKMVANSDLTLIIDIEDFAGDLHDATNIEIVLVAADSGYDPLKCDCFTTEADLYKDLAGGDITVTEDNQFRVALVPDDTKELFGRYYIDARFTAADGKIYPIRKKDMMPGTADIVKNLITEGSTP